MAAERLDALLLFHQESMFYLFGYDQLGYWVYQTALLRADSPDIIAISRVVDHDLIAGLPGVKEVRVWRDDSGLNPTDSTVDLLREVGLLKSGKRIGIEMRTHTLLPFYYKSIAEALPDDALVDASDLVTELRLRKSDAEVVYIREAGKVMDAAYKAAFAAMRPGALETEILGAAMAGMFSAGGHVPAIVPPFGSGPRTMAKTHGAAVDRKVQQGEPITIEPGCSRHRYHAVGVQTRWLGDPPRAALKVYEDLAATLSIGRDIIRPGLSTSHLAKELNRALEGFGIGIPGKHHGYGTGIGYPPTWLDNLRLKETDTHVLEKNMVFFLSGHWTLQGLADFPIELFLGEPILVTETGCERLSATPLSLG
jgi:Xaa-Pro dipeptidase